eukprot:7389357-Prymnesium_polylepis.1
MPRADARFAFVCGEARCAAMIFAKDARVRAVVGELLQRRQVVVAVEDADGLASLRQLFA